MRRNGIDRKMKINNIKRIISILLIVCLFGTSGPSFAQISSSISMPKDLPLSFGSSFFPQEIPGNAEIQNAPLKTFFDPLIMSEAALKDYVLGAGDLISIHIIVGNNALSLDYNFPIPIGGAIFFPNIGNIYLSGMSIKKAEEYLIINIKKYYHEPFRLTLMLMQPKMIRVFLTGNAQRPGPFSISDGTRISELIRSCGGAAPGGSARTVIIKRKNEKINVDLYNYILNGDISKDIFIRADDILDFPPVSDHRVTVLGDASRPGVYEIKKGEKLKDLLKVSGYTGVNSILSSVILLKRVKEKDEFVEYKLNLYDLSRGDEGQNVELVDGDMITIPSIETYIYLYGEVARSGRFSYLPGKKLSDYLNLAGGPTARANLGFVIVNRINDGFGKSKTFQINVSDILYRGVKKNDIEIMAGDIITVPTNFFYFSDFGSFANTILLGLSLYTAISNSIRK